MGAKSLIYNKNLYEFNQTTGRIKKASYEIKVEKDKLSTTKRISMIQNANCIYFAALDLQRAYKKIEKLLKPLQKNAGIENQNTFANPAKNEIITGSEEIPKGDPKPESSTN